MFRNQSRSFGSNSIRTLIISALATTAPLGGCFRMLSMLDHKGAGCTATVSLDRRRGLSCMNGMLNGQGCAGAIRLHAIGIPYDKHRVHRCRASLSKGQSQQRRWKRRAKISRLTRHTVHVSAMAGIPHLLPVTSTFGIWAALNLAAALGLWSEKTRHAPHMPHHITYLQCSLPAFLCKAESHKAFCACCMHLWLASAHI